MKYHKLIQNLYLGILHREPKATELEHWTVQLERGIELDVLTGKLLQSSEFEKVKKKVRNLFVAPGHFYSPIVDVDQVRDQFNATKPVSSVSGITINLQAHLATWNEFLPYLSDIPFPEESTDDFRYYFKNPAFSYGDGSILHAMLRRWRPKRLIEVGSGYSSACTIETVDRYLGGNVDVSFVEPYPQLLVQLLGEQSAKRFHIHANFVQQTDSAVFERLDDGDFLFIDSTHVMKTGSDVCYELFNILPKLKPGVFIHFHDIFWPFEYGRNWVINQNRSWNEIYGLRAFLMYNKHFEIVFFNDYFVKTCRDVVQRDYPGMLKNGGGSIWLRKLDC